LDSISGERQPELLVGIWPSKISHLPAQKGGFLFILDSSGSKYRFRILKGEVGE
jgi:hypothetical protein